MSCWVSQSDFILPCWSGIKLASITAETLTPEPRHTGRQMEITQPSYSGAPTREESFWKSCSVNGFSVWAEWAEAPEMTAEKSWKKLKYQSHSYGRTTYKGMRDGENESEGSGKRGERKRDWDRAQGPGVISMSALPLGTSSLRLREHARHAY